MEQKSVDILKDLINQYQHQNPNSKKAFQISKNSIPGGNTRDVIYYPPYPKYVKSGRGCWLVDIDGHKILDFMNNYMSLILGHAHPSIIDTIKNLAENGTAFSSPTESEFEFAEMIQNRVHSVKSLRFTNSGSESTTLALLAAKGYRRRKKIGKFEGAHHGTNEVTMVSTNPPLDKVGSIEEPNAVPDGPHIPDYITKNTVIMPFNNFEATEGLIKKNRDELSAIIIEPILGSNGIIPGEHQFLSAVREMTYNYDIPLIFDEVITGFRVSRGGAQEYYNIEPDLTAFGKILGGGLPIGAFGGREDLMAQFEPFRVQRISHSGSFNANPLSIGAGKAIIQELDQNIYDNLNNLCNESSNGLRKLFDDNNVEAQITHISSLFCIHFTSKKVFDYRTAMTEDSNLKLMYFLSLLINNVMIAPRGLGCISTPMNSTNVETLIRTSEDIVSLLKKDR